MVLVTGGSGLLGSHVILELLRSGKQVRALKRPNSSLLSASRIFGCYGPQASALFPKIEWVNGELQDIYSLLDALEGTEEVYHCAAMVSFDPKDEAELFRTNAEGTANLVNAALEKKIRKLCYVSSIAALGPEEDPVTEESWWKSSPGNSLYSISKYAAEREVGRAMEEGLNAVIINPSIILGPGDWNYGSSALFRRSQSGLRFYTQGMTGFVDVRDVAFLMHALMEKNMMNERFIVSSENMEFRQFFNIANACFGKPLPGLKAGRGLCELAWRLEKIKCSLGGRKPLITKETAAASQLRKRYSNEKIKKALGYEFIPVESSIRETCSLLLKEQQN